jgi:hypothetical protein
LCPADEPKIAKNAENRPFFVMAPVVLFVRGDSLRRSRAEDEGGENNLGLRGD